MSAIALKNVQSFPQKQGNCLASKEGQSERGGVGGWEGEKEAGVFGRGRKKNVEGQCVVIHMTTIDMEWEEQE